jgi:8-oxo-(d)GTP phosphatase
MEALDGEFVPSGEVDEMRWLAPADAGPLLTYDRDRELLREARL